MTYCYALSVLLGNESDRELVRGGLTALLTDLRDPYSDGWYDSINDAGSPHDSSKPAYAHAFVLLAASAGIVLGEPAAQELHGAIRAVIDERFWDDDAGVMRESFDAQWQHSEPYRGANANMHTVEAFLAAADATGDDSYLRRAERIARTFIDGFARAHDWRLPEHYAADLTVLPDYNRDDPMHRFRPFGVTPGHLLEWARLCLQLAGSLRESTGWHLDAARALYDRAVTDGWHADGRDGFVYTIDFDGKPVARTRMWWVLAEAMGAAAALHTVTGEQRYADDGQKWWHEAQRHFIDLDGGSWHHALDDTNAPDDSVWNGKPDIYHSLQAVLLPGRPVAPSLLITLSDRATGGR